MTTTIEKIFWVSSSHWDREWYRPFEGFRCDLVAMVDRAIECVTHVNGYRFFFLDGQSIILEDYLAVRPEMEPQLRQLITDGRIAAGPFYVLQDEMIEDGELLVRNLQRGMALARRFGAREFVGYSPDAFGHCAQLPQLLRLAGVNSALFSRGIDGTQQENRWVGPDGSEVFLLWLPFGYGGYAHHDCLEGGRHIPEDRDEALAMFEQRFDRLRAYVTSGLALVMDGGDHLLPDPNAVRLAADFNAAHPEGPRFEIASLTEATRAIARHAAPCRVDGEMRTTGEGSTGWVLPGTYTTRMPLKVGLAALTRRLLALEKLATMCPYSQVSVSQIERGWELLLQNIPHDSICGCHVDEVYLENLNRLNAVRALLAHGYEQTLRAFVPLSAKTASSAKVVLYDPAPNPAIFKSFQVECPYPSIEKPDQVALGAKDVEFLITGVEPYWTIHSHLKTYRIQGLYRNRTGDNVLDAKVETTAPRRPDRDATPAGRHAAAAPAFAPLTFVDSGDAGDTYNYSPPQQDTVVHSQGEPQTLHTRRLSDYLVQTRAEIRLAVPASLSADRRSRSQDKTDLRINYEIISDGESGLTWVDGVVHNTARDHRLRIVFPTTVQDTHSYAGAPFHVERRPVSLAFDPARYTERPLTDYPFIDYIRYGGLSIYTRGNGEYQITPRGIEVTLCRCVGWIGRPDLDYRKGQAGPFCETPMAQLVGTDIPFGFVLARSLPDPVADYRRKELLLETVAQCVLSDHSQPIRQQLPLQARGAELVALRWVSERELEARLLNASDKPVSAQLEIATPCDELFEVDLNHQRVTGGFSASHATTASVPMRPWQLLTLKVVALSKA